MDIKMVANISIWKTLRFNQKYFGLRRILHPAVIVSKNVILKKLKGEIQLFDNQMGGG